MQINLNYTGAQSAIASQQRKEIDVFSMAGQTIEVERNGQAVKLTFSFSTKSSIKAGVKAGPGSTCVDP